ncbi:MAG: hypothetical protein H6835_07050 [Planctomycetes bacterium]|nr:hypothetical protein [Planctomycetota bacterium]
MKHTSLLGLAATLAVAPLAAQSIPVPLAYNFNGIVHAGEDFLPDDPNGYRSISDRGLDFTLGIPSDPVLAAYQLVDQPYQLDIVHVGNRNTVDGGNKMFDAVANGDNLGTQPTWLASVDQTGTQTTVLAAPMPIGSTTKAAFLFQISNGGGVFDVTFTLASGGSYTAQLSGNDWFGGPLPGTDGVDQGSHPANNLSVTEQRVDLSAYDGDVVTEISFGNRSNALAGYAVLACNFEYPPEPSRVNQIDLTYNWNGIVHAGEMGPGAPGNPLNPGQADDPNSYRSIADRGLDFTAGVPADPTIAPYKFQTQPFALDIVYLGNRNLGGHVFDLTADGDATGVEPAWLNGNPDLTGPQTTTLPTDGQILLDVTSKASLLVQISNGGASFDVTFSFASGGTHTVTTNAGDWWGGSLPGTTNQDNPYPEHNLSLTERNFDLSAFAGEVLTAVSFSNSSNPDRGIAITSLNVVGCVHCVNGSTHAITNLGGSSGTPTSGNVYSTSTGGLGCKLDWNITGTTPFAVGLCAIGTAPVSAPLSILIPGCSGTIRSSAEAIPVVFANAFGAATYGFDLPADQVFCGASFFGQFAMLDNLPCWLNLSDAIQIQIGD